MKLKYYLRGIGIGIIFSIIVFSVALTSNKTYDISDEEVMKRARELGMVYSSDNDNSLTLNDLLNKTDENKDESEIDDNLEPTKAVELTPTNEPTPTIEPTPIIEPMPTIEPTKKVEPTPTTKPTQVIEPTPTIKPTKEVEPTKKVEPTKVAEPTKKVEPTKVAEPTKEVEPTKVVENYVSIKVTKGMSSEVVAKMLTKEGVVTDSNDFNNYLKKHDYSRKINVGTYKIKMDASYEEIAKMLTTKK